MVALALNIAVHVAFLEGNFLGRGRTCVPGPTGTAANHMFETRDI